VAGVERKCLEEEAQDEHDEQDGEHDGGHQHPPARPRPLAEHDGDGPDEDHSPELGTPSRGGRRLPGGLVRAVRGPWLDGDREEHEGTGADVFFRSILDRYGRREDVKVLRAEKNRFLAGLLKENKGSGIVYAGTRRGAEQIAARHGYERRSVWTLNRRDAPTSSSITREFYLGLGAGSASYTGRGFWVNATSAIRSRVGSKR